MSTADISKFVCVCVHVSVRLHVVTDDERTVCSPMIPCVNLHACLPACIPENIAGQHYSTSQCSTPHYMMLHYETLLSV